MKRFLFRKTLPYFVGRDEQTGEYIIFNNWKIDIVEVCANSMEEAIWTLSLTGIKEPDHYDDILELIGYIE